MTCRIHTETNDARVRLTHSHAWRSISSRFNFDTVMDFARAIPEKKKVLIGTSGPVERILLSVFWRDGANP